MNTLRIPNTDIIVGPSESGMEDHPGVQIQVGNCFVIVERDIQQNRYLLRYFPNDDSCVTVLLDTEEGTETDSIVLATMEVPC